MNMNQGNAGLSHYVFNQQKQGTVIKPLPGLALNCKKNIFAWAILKSAFKNKLRTF